MNTYVQFIKKPDERDRFNKHMKKYRFYSAKIDSVVKNQVLAVL